MYSHPFSYHRAATLEEASKLLLQLGEEARVLAGGQSLIPLMKMRLARPAALVDINGIPGLNTIQRRDGELRFGALSRHADLENSEIVRPSRSCTIARRVLRTCRCATRAPSAVLSPKPIPAAIGAPFFLLS